MPRVARLIERLTGVSYHPGHVWRLLGALDWTLQRPAQRARERNEAAIAHWFVRDAWAGIAPPLRPRGWRRDPRRRRGPRRCRNR
ncbi:MAG: winged helix-turn-helix domain-containing protein [Acidobacteria bacterium]|nr:winged helix-turn-helix domain-containing protein [Acidobacteriota bacterium]